MKENIRKESGELQSHDEKEGSHREKMSSGRKISGVVGMWETITVLWMVEVKGEVRQINRWWN